ncbi:MAG: hypothetical protein ACJ07L_09550 [Opitutales bacterium]
MLTFLKIVVSFITISAVGYQLAYWMDYLAGSASPTKASKATNPIASISSQEIDTIDTPAALVSNSSIESLVSTFLDSKRETGAFTLEKKLSALDLEELEDFYIEALSLDLIDRRAFEAAGLALEAVATQDPALAVQLLYALSPSEKERLATDLSKGWAQHDALSAWDWIDSAWIDSDGEFIDRKLQNQMFHEALGVVLAGAGKIQLAADLVSSLLEPELRNELAEQIAYRVVSENPAQALGNLNFEGDALIDSAIMDAIMSEWSNRDSIGAMNWTLQNESQVSNQGMRSIAKDLLLNGVHEELVAFHSNLIEIGKRDSVAWESARLLARRDPQISIDWISAIETPISRYRAFNDSLYEIGHDDFSSSIQFAELAYGVADLDRETVLFQALQSWSAVDSEKVRAYLGRNDNLTNGETLDALRKSIN